MFTSTKTFSYSKTTVVKDGKVVSERRVLNDGGQAETPEELKEMEREAEEMLRKGEEMVKEAEGAFEGLFKDLETHMKNLRKMF